MKEAAANTPFEGAKYPKTQYFKTKNEFDVAVGEDFINYANKAKGERFLVGLSHGQSPSGAYKYILDNYHRIKNPEIVRYTFVNSPLKHQKNLSEDITDAGNFLKALVRKNLLDKENILGSNLKGQKMETYAKEFDRRLGAYIKKYDKEGLDYVFLATSSAGHVAGISRNSSTFGSKKIVEIVEERKIKKITGTPQFLKKSKRIAFLTTKAEKRRALGWLFYKNGKPNESPSFLRHIDDVENRMTVFIDDEALTWPQVEVLREGQHGISTIRIDVAKPYNEDAKRKLPVVLLIHGFLGLNSFDGLLTGMPSRKYIAAAMHYGSIPDALPINRYSHHVVNNIDAAVNFFGSKGHPVYILDHSMGNVYFMMINRDINRLKGIKKYLRGRIGANPFFGIESKHALLGFMDNVIIPSLKLENKNRTERVLLKSLRSLIPIDTKKGVRNRGIKMTDFLIRKDSAMRDRVWKSVKERIIYLMTNMDSLPVLNRIPIERALNRLPVKLFVIQIHSALLESKTFDEQVGSTNMEKNDIPILILKSDRDAIAKYLPRIYKDENCAVIDITNRKEKDLFREHLYHMVCPEETIQLVDEFITEVEESYL